MRNDPHAYQHGANGGGACAAPGCGLPPEHSLHTYTLPGFEDAPSDRAQAEAIQQSEELTARLLEPRANIDRRTREIEQLSPLFRYTDANPQSQLF